MCEGVTTKGLYELRFDHYSDDYGCDPFSNCDFYFVVSVTAETIIPFTTKEFDSEDIDFTGDIGLSNPITGRFNTGGDISLTWDVWDADSGDDLHVRLVTSTASMGSLRPGDAWTMKRINHDKEAKGSGTGIIKFVEYNDDGFAKDRTNLCGAVRNFVTVVIRHNCHLAIQSTIQSTIQNEARIQSERDVKTKGERGVEGRHHLPIALSLRSAPHSESWIESRGDNYVG
eukprot:sb/3469473/